MPELDTLLSQPEWRLLVALAVGLILGSERERRKGARPREELEGGAAFGVRTFTLAALIGAVGAFSASVWLLAASALFIGGLAIVASLHRAGPDHGTTSEVALFLAFLLGALAMSYPAHALGLGVVSALVLALRTRLHQAITRGISEQELVDGLTLAVFALVVLPLVPDRPIDPWHVVNPFVVWRLVVLVMAVTGFGHIAQRMVGPRYGLAIAGFVSGFVSSAATVAALGSKSKLMPRALLGAVAGAAASSVATYAQLALLVGAANPSLLRRLAPALGFGALCAGAYAVVFTLRSLRDADTESEQRPGRAFDIRAAMLFGLLISAVSIASTLLRDAFGEAAMRVAALVAGFADAHAIAASLASTSASEGMPNEAAAWGILLALTTNTVTKGVLARTSGTSEYALRVSVGLVLMLAATWVPFALY